jgi:hypothetical protein
MSKNLIGEIDIGQGVVLFSNLWAVIMNGRVGVVRLLLSFWC